MDRLDEIIGSVLERAGLALDAERNRAVTIRNPQEASLLFRYASETGLKVQISGSGSKASSSGDKLIVKTTGMNSVSEVSERDMLISAGAGMPVKNVSQFTEKYGCRLDEYEGTIGGCLAGESSIVRSQLGARILALTYVSPTGNILKLGSHAVKDVAGYRIFPLLYGSKGKLGLITDVIINIANIFRDYKPVQSKRISDSHSGESVLRKLEQDIVSEIDPKGILQ
jgi:FAD/FMN-containing dehydrogenase